MHRKPKSSSGYFATAEQPKTRACERPGCGAPGEHKAPKSRNRLNDYHWFCLDHVREYNLQWNYYAGLDEIQVEELRRHETVWERPSWPFGPKAQYRKFRDSFARQWGDFRDRFGIFDDEAADSGTTYNRQTASDMDYNTMRALNTLGLTPPLDWERAKAHYKALVKKFHPDLHGGDKSAEERFKSINEAFQTIKKMFGETV